jgi:hypothetical protein
MASHQFTATLSCLRMDSKKVGLGDFSDTTTTRTYLRPQSIKDVQSLYCQCYFMQIHYFNNLHLIKEPINVLQMHSLLSFVARYKANLLGNR